MRAAMSTAIVELFVVPLPLALPQQTPQIIYALKSLVTIVTAASVLAFMFGPKMYVTVLRKEKNTDAYVTSKQNVSCMSARAHKRPLPLLRVWVDCMC